MAVINEKFATGLFIGMTPAAGIVAARADDGSDVVAIAWDPVTGDATWSAPAGSAVGGGTRRHLFDRPIVSTSTLTIGGAGTLGGDLSFSQADPKVKLAANYYLALTSGTGVITLVSNTVTAFTIPNNGTGVIVAGKIAAGDAALDSQAMLYALGTYGLRLKRDGGSAPTTGNLTIFHSNIGYSGGTGADTLYTADWGHGFYVNAQSGSATLSLIITNAGHLRPATDNALDTGSGSFRWRMGYFTKITAGGANPATVGTILLPNENVISWRNAANSADHTLRLNSANTFAFDAPLSVAGSITSSSFIGAQSGAQLRAYNASNSTYVALYHDGTQGVLNTNIVVDGTLTVTGTGLTISSTVPRFVLWDTNGTVDQRRFDWTVSTNTLDLEARTDAVGFVRVIATFPFGGGASFGGNVSPLSDNSNDLGTSSFRWRAGYFGGSLNSGQHTIQAGQTNSIVIGQFTSSGTYSMITLNGATASTTMMGLIGRGSGDDRLQLRAPTAGGIDAVIGGSVTFLFNPNGVQANGFLDTYHNSSGAGAGYYVRSITDTTGATPNTIGAFGVLQSHANMRRGYFIISLANDAAPATVWTVDRLGTLSIDSGGYTGQLGMDGTGMYLSHNSAVRDIELRVNGTVALAVGVSGLGAGSVAMPNIGTTANAANAYIDNSASNRVLRSTSSERYKRDIEAYDVTRARDAIMHAEALLFASLADADNPERHFVGFSAERLWNGGKGEGKRFVHLTRDSKMVDGKRVAVGEPYPDGVAYASFVVPHNVMLRDHEQRIAKLEQSLTQ